MCYYCEHGLPERVRAIFEAVSSAAPQYEFGPGHIVYSDCNLAADHIQWCIQQHDERRQEFLEDDWTSEELDASREGLIALLAIPEAERNPAAFAREAH